MALLTSADYPEIRDAIDVSLDSDSLPDSVIGRSIYVGRAEAYIASRTTDTDDSAKRACIYYTAYLLVKLEAIPALKSEDYGVGGNYSREPFNAVRKAAALLEQVEEELGETVEIGPDEIQVVTLRGPCWF